jgi:hypothetical protein
MKDPQIINTLLNKEDYENLLKSIGNPKNFNYDKTFSRYTTNETGIPILKELTNKVLEDAKKIFNSETLLPTYALFSHYEGQDPEPSLFKHKDTNACTYTIDMCVYQNEPWDLWVEDNFYCLYPNQALAYYGEDQFHWREKFPNPETNSVAMIFFHFAEPDHWYFSKGPSYLDVVWGNITEEDWSLKNAKG